MFASVSILWRSFSRVCKPDNNLRINAVSKARFRTEPAGCVQPWYVLLKRAQHLTFLGVDFLRL